jgi:hypothetical protein
VLIVLGLFALAVGAAFLFGGVSDSKALHRSITRGANSPFDADCSEGQGQRRCWVTEPAGSGGARYRVSEQGDCWSARLIPGGDQAEAPMPERLEGCVALRDRYPFIETAFDAWEAL